MLGTVALEDRDELARACERYGERIAVSLDVRGGELESRGWMVGSGVPLEEAVTTFQRAGASMFIYTDIGRDGMLSGPDLHGLKWLASLTDVPLIASGGIASLDGIREVARLRGSGIVGAIVGRALYEGRFTVREANMAADEVSAES